MEIQRSRSGRTTLTGETGRATVWFATLDQFARFLAGVTRQYDVYGPRLRDGALGLCRLDRDGGPIAWEWNDYRLARPLKSLFFQPTRAVAGWSPELPGGTPSGDRPRAVVGAKACDLAALEIVDRVFRTAEHREPEYAVQRDQNLLIAGDCTDCGETCFCTMVGGLPYPTGGFDLNLSPAGEGYAVEVGSERGWRLLDEHHELFREAKADELETRLRNRERVQRTLIEQNAQFATKDPFATSIQKHLKTRIWGELAASCVECNACNFICPTCHCFLLMDCRSGKLPLRHTLWDSCFQAGYARMAGGGTPRLQLTERFKNHYYHKFVGFPENWGGGVACTGCGRCIDACMGRIDKRNCLHRLETRWIPTEVVEEL